VGSKAGATCRDCSDVASYTMPPTPGCPLASYVMHGAPGCAIDAAAMVPDRNLILKDFGTWRNYRGEMIPRFLRLSALDFSNTTTEDDKT